MKTIRIPKDIYESIKNRNPAEVERGEYLQTPDGQVAEVMGKKHSEGGELIYAPDGTKVVSDYVKIGASLAKMFKKEFGLNVVAGSTFATVINRYKKIFLSLFISLWIIKTLFSMFYILLNSIIIIFKFTKTNS